MKHKSAYGYSTKACSAADFARVLEAAVYVQRSSRPGSFRPLVPLKPEHLRVHAGNFLGKLNSPHDDVYDVSAHRASLQLRSSPDFLSLSLGAIYEERGPHRLVLNSINKYLRLTAICLENQQNRI